VGSEELFLNSAAFDFEETNRGVVPQVRDNPVLPAGGHMSDGVSTKVTVGKKVALGGLSVFALGVLGVLWALFGVALGLLPPMQPSLLIAISGGLVIVGLTLYIAGRFVHWYKTG
jgi:hypothetical protein